MMNTGGGGKIISFLMYQDYLGCLDYLSFHPDSFSCIYYGSVDGNDEKKRQRNDKIAQAIEKSQYLHPKTLNTKYGCTLGSIHYQKRQS